VAGFAMLVPLFTMLGGTRNDLLQVPLIVAAVAVIAFAYAGYFLYTQFSGKSTARTRTAFLFVYLLTIAFAFFAPHFVTDLAPYAWTLQPSSPQVQIPQPAFDPVDSIQEPPGQTIRNPTEALVQIPLRMGNIPPGFEAAVEASRPTIHFADGTTWTSHWQSVHGFKYGLGKPKRIGDGVAAFLMDRTLFDRMAMMNATVHLEVSMILFQNSVVSGVYDPNGFTVPGLGICSGAGVRYFVTGAISCRIPWSIPQDIQVNSTLVDGTCGYRVSAGSVHVVGHIMGTASFLDRSPLDPLKKVNLTFTLDKGGLAPPPCGGQALNFTIERTTSHALRKLDLAPIHLADYQF
jgi:hypothetical protein